MSYKQKFYNRNWFIWIALILFAPLGIFLMWKNHKFTKKIRAIPSGIFALLFFIIVSGVSCSNNNSIQTSTGKKATGSNVENSKSNETQSSSATDAKTNNDSKPVSNESSNNTTVVNGQLKVHFIDVGQADCILVQQGNSSMLIDAGNNEDTQTIKSYLDSQGVKALDVVVGTHAHEDHIGSMDYIINSFKVGKVYFPKQTSTTKTFQDFISAVKNKGLQLTAPVVGSSFKIGDATATILAPNGSGYEDANDYSIVIKLTYGSTSFLLTGDAEATSESQMLSNRSDLSATVLKVGHHGSRTSTSQTFLDKVNPKYALISVGKGNSYGHPTQETLNRLKNKGVVVYRTDENGTVVATSDGKNVSFNTQPGSYNGITSSSTSNSSNNQTSVVVKPTPAPTPAPSQNKSVTVYITNSGKKYHVAGCRYLSKSQIPISLDDAKAGGYGPCSVCHPPQ
ncbi:ComEC/Rec2 family competence protein [Candidatus Clostridium radicumherbarum]|uniref:ComEC/Rec2 family competence protein n=1 Tax=Candidatus Clostridium radicumherbarum TaxID=3381662 RepID=A0ABW8TTV1_9CLOT